MKIEIRKGEIALGKSEYDKALDHIALSLQILFDNFLEMKQNSFPFSPYDFGDDISFFTNHYL